MPLRDIALTLTVLGLLPVCFVRPWIGILVWSWFAYMNPHRHTWGFAYDLPFSMLVAIVTLAGFVFTKDRRPLIWSRETIVLASLWGWFTVTSVFALYPGDAWTQWERVSKIFLMTFLTIPLFQDRRKLRLLLLVIAASLGFYAVKGAAFVLRTGGEFMALGAPGDTFISSNTALALALNMCLPIFFYLAKEEPRRWLRVTLYAMFFASLVAVPFTYSRGGVLGLAVVLAFLFLKARQRLLLIPVLLAGLLAFSFLAPEKWAVRMETIWNYEQDQSAMSRLVAWRVGYELANDRPLTGGGFWIFNKWGTWARYAPEYPNRGLDAHSIYFNLLGEHGYIGLGLFLLFAIFTLATLRRLRKLGRQFHELAWVSNYSHMLQVSILAYLVTGAFLSVAYFDLAYHLLIIVVILKQLAAQELGALSPQVAPIQVRGQTVPVGLTSR